MCDHIEGNDPVGLLTETIRLYAVWAKMPRNPAIRKRFKKRTLKVRLGAFMGIGQAFGSISTQHISVVIAHPEPHIISAENSVATAFC